MITTKGRPRLDIHSLDTKESPMYSAIPTTVMIEPDAAAAPRCLSEELIFAANSRVALTSCCRRHRRSSPPRRQGCSHILRGQKMRL